MKKLFTTLLTVLTSGAAFALPVGNPSEASLLCDGICWEGRCGDMCDPCLTWCEAFNFRVGFYGDYVFQRHMQSSQKYGKRGYYDNFSLSTNAAYLDANFWDRIDIFATLGASQFFADGNNKILLGSNQLHGAYSKAFVGLESQSAFSWSVGTRGTLWECGCTTLGAEAQYFQFNPNIKRVELGSAGNIDGDILLGNVTNPTNVKAKYEEWQIGLGLSHRIHCFVPYAAIKWSGARLVMNSAAITFINGSVANDNNVLLLRDARTSNVWGYAVGVSVIDCEKAALTAEFRGGDETAAYVNGQIRF